MLHSDCFLAVGADEQLDFRVLYASARGGWASAVMPSFPIGETGEGAVGDMCPLLDAILESCPSPEGDPDAPFKMLVANGCCKGGSPWADDLPVREI